MRLIEQAPRRRGWSFGLGALALAGLALAPAGAPGVVGAIVVVGACALLLNSHRRADEHLREQLREERGAICPGCGCPHRYFRAGACPECGEASTAERARAAWRDAIGLRWPGIVPAANVCSACGYDLTGLRDGRCPECGVDL